MAAVAWGQRVPEGRAVAAARRPSTQATMRRLARSTASQSQPLRRLRPTKGQRSSNAKASQRLRGACWGRRRGRGGRGRGAFFCPVGPRHARNTRHAYAAALRITPGQELFHLALAGRPLARYGHQAGLVATGFTVIAGMPLCPLRRMCSRLQRAQVW